ncbi:MAG: aminoacyl-tRNA deacylase [Phycisphaerae bacterium]
MDLIEYLQQQRVSFERLQHPTAYTAQALAAQQHVPGRYVAKPVLVKADQEFVLCVLPAPSMVDLDRVAAALGVESAELASEDDLARIFPDCELGAEPPFGHLYGLTTLMDEALSKAEFLLFQAGSHTQAIKISQADYQRLASPRIVSFARAVA